MVVGGIHLTVPEILENFKNAESKNEKKAILLDNKYNKALQEVLRGAFDERISWIDFDDVEWTSDDAPIGLTPSHLGVEMRREKIGRFRVETGAQIPLDKINSLFQDLMSSLHQTDADLLINMFKKDLKIRGLDKKIVKEVFPHLLRN